jgi:hypothetical protein
MADENEYDPWATSSGLVDDVTVTIADAYFTFDPGYNDGQTLVLKIEGHTDDGDSPEFDAFFPCGNGWETTDKGATASREDGKRKGFNKNTGYGMFFLSAIECGAGDVLKSRGTPMEAAVWKGLVFHMKRKEVDYGGEIGKKDKLVCTEFFPDGAPGGKPSAAAPAAASGPRRATPPAEEGTSPATASTGGNGSILADLPVPLRAKLKAAAKGAANHDGFIEAAYGIDGVDGNPALEEALLDPAGIYAELVG